MRYFVEELAPWFDSCDAGKHFALLIPDRAAHCPALLHAVYSASARHLSRCQSTGSRPVAFAGRRLPDLGDTTALDYQTLCISHLPLPSSCASTRSSMVSSLAFWAALAGGDDGTHLRGTQVFLNAQGANALREGGLQLAAFWVGIRQEFHKAFLEQRVVELDLSCCDASVYRQLDPADDATWANRAVLHCVDALVYCYGDGCQTRWRYEQLCEYSRQWQTLTPPTFDPLYCRQPDPSKGEVFPILWYLDDCIVTAIQHWHLARLLLTVFDPAVPRLGPGRKAAVNGREIEVKHHVFSLCGIAISNKTAPALVAACMGVSMCGDRMTDRREQEALLDILIKTERIHGLATVAAQTHLQAAWEWTLPVLAEPSV
ncbi:hypothetical protein BO94DRAFT_554147 [Aspergillus sclerotioniger CBS 115572]|uniref:Uncharacterized protein n=1 Tax=Aspergillus sclerotioniger CBS 115572 TaxID=1450535 RepID=A0A317XBM8_9EURO|nr:hypothetical protein BO94DRAFT_554147 [Aspergillus sclerotioniger CBS 115572]PWY94368.1 hypothetical protein BO94DRAFT_554147 [Aspergillus sclerotioniger CBS 115572]